VPARLAALDRQLSQQLTAVLHHPDFQQLESTWRGLHYLVHQTATGEDLKIRVLDVTKQELVQDCDPGRTLQQSDLFQKIYRQEYGHVDGEPYGLLVADYEFGHHAEDVQLLRSMAGVAAAAHAPLIAGASPRLFQIERYTELAGVRRLDAIFKGSEYAAWRSFRDSDDSRYVALTLPRVRARLPYGSDGAHALEFAFEECGDGKEPGPCLWMNAAWAYATRITAAFAREGWFARVRGVAGGGTVEGLPVGISPADDGSVVMKCPTEIAISDRREFELSNLGFLPLLHSKNRDFAVFMGAQSAQKPKQFFDPVANAKAELSARFPYILCMSRFALYLKVMARDLLAAAVPVEECQRVLGDWLRQYSLSIEECEQVSREDDGDYWAPGPHASRPITEVALELRHGPHNSGHEVTVTLRLFFRWELEVPAALRLVLSVPRLI
jgi:type VI secretion system protein ImpC